MTFDRYKKDNRGTLQRKTHRSRIKLRSGPCYVIS